MAWIKVKDPIGRIFTVPEGAYKNFYYGNPNYSLVQESKPAPIQEKIKKEIIKNEQISKSNSNENHYTRKDTKKTNI